MFSTNPVEDKAKYRMCMTFGFILYKIGGVQSMKCQILCCTGQMGNFISRPAGSVFIYSDPKLDDGWGCTDKHQAIDKQHASLSVMATVVTYVQFEDIKIVMLHWSVTFYFCSITVCTGACRHTIESRTTTKTNKWHIFFSHVTLPLNTLFLPPALDCFFSIFLF